MNFNETEKILLRKLFSIYKVTLAFSVPVSVVDIVFTPFNFAFPVGAVVHGLLGMFSRGVVAIFLRQRILMRIVGIGSGHSMCEFIFFAINVVTAIFLLGLYSIFNHRWDFGF